MLTPTYEKNKENQKRQTFQWTLEQATECVSGHHGISPFCASPLPSYDQVSGAHLVAWIWDMHMRTAQCVPGGPQRGYLIKASQSWDQWGFGVKTQLPSLVCQSQATAGCPGDPGRGRGPLSPWKNPVGEFTSITVKCEKGGMDKERKEGYVSTSRWLHFTIGKVKIHISIYGKSKSLSLLCLPLSLRTEEHLRFCGNISSAQGSPLQGAFSIASLFLIISLKTLSTYWRWAERLRGIRHHSNTVSLMATSEGA